jgi:hypothetical protein
MERRGRAHTVRRASVGESRAARNAGSSPPRAPMARAVVVTALARAADTYAAAGYTVILDCILGPWLLEEFLADLSSPGAEVDYLVLRPSLEVALQRATGTTADRRPRHGRPLGSEPARHLYEQFAELGLYERHVLDCTDQTPQERTRHPTVAQSREPSPDPRTGVTPVEVVLA